MTGLALRWAIQASRQRDLSPGAKLVLLSLADFHTPAKGVFPKQTTLAEACEMSRSQINVHLAALENAGLIRREQRYDRERKQRDNTVYHLAMEVPYVRQTGHSPMSDEPDIALCPKPMSDFQGKPMSGLPDNNLSNAEPSSACKRQQRAREAAAADKYFEDPFAELFHQRVLEAAGIEATGKWLSSKQRAISAAWLTFGGAITEARALNIVRGTIRGTHIGSLAYFNDAMRQFANETRRNP